MVLPDTLWTHSLDLASLRRTPYARALEKMALELKEDRLFDSHWHGRGHIYRVMVLGALLAQRAQLTPEWTRLLMLACAYHDVGREDDSEDWEHGMRSAKQLAEITGLTGRPLASIQAVVEAHSRADRDMDAVLNKYGVGNDAEVKRLALLFKDADALDRVRLHELDITYLRHSFSAELEPLAWQLLRILR